MPFKSESATIFGPVYPFSIMTAVPSTAEVQEDFWEVVGDLFADNYFGQIHKFDRKAEWISTRAI